MGLLNWTRSARTKLRRHAMVNTILAYAGSLFGGVDCVNGTRCNGQGLSVVIARSAATWQSRRVPGLVGIDTFIVTRLPRCARNDMRKTERPWVQRCAVFLFTSPGSYDQPVDTMSGNCSDLQGSMDHPASHRGAAKHGISISNRFRPLKREQLGLAGSHAYPL